MEEKKTSETSIKEQLGTGKKIIIKKKSTSASSVPTESQKAIDGIFDKDKLEQAKKETVKTEEITTEISAEKAKKEQSSVSVSTSSEKIEPTLAPSSSPSPTTPPLGLTNKIERNPIISRPIKTEKPSTGSTSSPQETGTKRASTRVSSFIPKSGKQGANRQSSSQQHSKKSFQKSNQNKQQGSPTNKPSQAPKLSKFSIIETPPAEIAQTETASHAGRKRNLFIVEKTKEKEEALEENSKFFKQIQQKKSSTPVSGTSVPKEISIMENIQVGELAKKLNLKPNDVIAKLMKMGTMVTINNVIDSETAAILADEYGCKVKIVSLYEETVIHEEPDNPEDYITRPPVVTIMGHVDHGKTKLLDTIRQSAVAESEAGGITQHIGAYQVTTDRGTITFLDTPGHEAFTQMRARGASITDIVVLVVAADDGVMPQTIEAINHAKEAKVPIVVAINKIDLPQANPEKVMQELANLGLQAEEWGGATITCKISAKQKIGIDKLLEMILLQAEILELKANPNRKAKGTVLEARLDPGRGPVATVLVQNGTLRVGDPFLAGVYSGKVRAMFNDHGQSIKEAPPSCPVLVTGLDSVPDAGDPFDVIRDEKEARQISQHRKEYQRIGQAKNMVRVTLDNMNEIIQQGALKELKIIIKSDVRGTAEAIEKSLQKLSNESVRLTVIHSGTGAITDSDVMLASASNAIIIGFHVRANPRTASLAEREGVQIKYYSIIYDVENDIRAAMEGLLEPERIEVTTGKLEIRKIFYISKVGNIAGCMVIEGKVHKNHYVRVIRNDVVVFDGKIKSLKRNKDDVSEVLAGFECGLALDGFNDIQEGDELETYEVQIVPRKLK